MDSFFLDSDDDPMDGFFMDQGPDISQIMKDFGINSDDEISADEDENPKPKSLRDQMFEELKSDDRDTIKKNVRRVFEKFHISKNTTRAVAEHCWEMIVICLFLGKIVTYKELPGWKQIEHDFKTKNMPTFTCKAIYRDQEGTILPPVTSLNKFKKPESGHVLLYTRRPQMISKVYTRDDRK